MDTRQADKAIGGLRQALRELGKGFQQSKALKDFNKQWGGLNSEAMKSNPIINGFVNRMSALGRAFRNGVTSIRDFNRALRDQQRWLRQSDPSIGRNAAMWRVWKAAIGDGARGALGKIGDGVSRLIRPMADGSRYIRDFTAALRDYNRWLRQADPSISRTSAAMRTLRDVVRDSDAGILRLGRSLKAGVSNIRDFNEALRQQQQWLRQSNPDIGKGASMWQLWKNAIRDADTGSTRSLVRIGDSLRNFRNALKESSEGSIFSRLSGFLNRSGSDAENTGKQFENSGRRMARWKLYLMAFLGLGAPALGLVAGLLAGLPSLAMAAGAAAGVLALGWEGIKKAAGSLKAPIDDLKKSVSSTFEDRLTPVFDKLAGALPKLDGPLNNVAHGMSDMFSGIVDTVTSAEGMAHINTILNGTADLFRQMTPGMKDFTSGFLEISAAGASSFGHLSGMMNGFAAQFKGSVSKVVADGTFDGAMKGMAVSLGELLSQLDLLMVAGLKAMAALGEPMADFFQGFGDLLIGMMPGLTAFSAALFSVFGAIGTHLGGVFAELGPAFEAVFGLIGTVLTDLVNMVGPMLTTLARAIGPVIEQIATALGPVLEGLMGALGPALQGLVGPLTTVAQVLGDAVVTALQAIGPFLPPLVETLGAIAAVIAGVIATTLQALAPLLPVLVEAIGQIAQIIGDALLVAVEALAPLIPSLVEAFSALLAAIVPLLPTIAEMVGVVLATLIPAIVALIPPFIRVVQIIANVVTALVPLVQGFMRFGTTVIEVAAIIVGKLISAIAWLLEQIASIIGVVGSVISSVLGAVDAGASAVVNYMTELPGRAKAALGNLGALLVDSGRALIEGFINGIKSMLGAVKSAAASVVSAVRDFFPFSPAKVGPFSGAGYTDNSGKALVSDFAAGMLSKRDEVASAASKVVGDARDQFLKDRGMSDGWVKAINIQAGGSLAADLAAQEEELEAQQDALDIEKLRAEIAEKKAGSEEEKERAKAVSEALDLRQSELDLQKKQLELTKKETKAQANLNKEYGTLLGKALGVPVDFVEAAGDQFMSDLGFSNDGLFPTLLTEGTKYIFNISNVDEAIAIKQREQNKEALQFNRR